MALEIEVKDKRFRLEGEELRTGWICDRPANRKCLLAVLYQLEDKRGKRLLSQQELSVLLAGGTRQAASAHWRRYVDSGEDMEAFLRRQCKVDEEVVEAVEEALQQDPWAREEALLEQVQEKLGRQDLNRGNVHTALEQISCLGVRRAVRQRLERGEAHYKEEYLLEEMMREQASPLGARAGLEAPEAEGMSVTDPTAVRALLTPGASLSRVGAGLIQVIACMAFFYHGVPLSVLGRWMGVHKTTILRRMLGACVLLWPTVAGWVQQKVKVGIVYLDEKWIKIQGKWYYWFVVLDAPTAVPVLAVLLVTRNRWAVRWVGIMLRRLKQIPHTAITDGLPSYRHLAAALQAPVRHLVCLFHFQQGITRWLKEHFTDKKQIAYRKKLMKQVFQTRDKRTVKRRWQKLKQRARELGIEGWIAQTEPLLDQLLPAVGSRRLPNTTNAIERFFRAFNRFYKPRGGFFSVVSAKRQLILFQLLYLFVQQAETGQAPIEAILPEAKDMPFYQIVNNPLACLLGADFVKSGSHLADSQVQELLAA